MVRKISCFILIFFLYSCNKENAGDCFQTAGKIIKSEVELPLFSKVTVHENIELFIKEGPVQKVEIETGKNLLPEIITEVIDGELILTNENTCNFFRDYNLTKVYITSPNLTVIRNASELNINSIGVLTYPELYLRSSGEKGNFLSLGDFHLTIENQLVTIWGNGIAVFFLDGTSDKLRINFTDGDTRFEGKDFKVKDILLKNVSSNDMIVYPVESIKGKIRSTGNVIVHNKPPIVEVEELSIGKLIFK